jgi:GTPase SAR1 family protein
VGKTSLIEALCHNKACESSIGFDNNSEKKSYMETPGKKNKSINNGNG